MNFDSPETWRWIWVVAALAFTAGEMFSPGSFFSLPFGVGAAVAAFLAFLGVPVALTFLVFLVVSGLAFGAFWKLGRKMERRDEQQEGVGATRWVGQQARVTEEIEAGGLGTVRIDREEWRAEALTGERIRTGSTVMVTRVSGLRLVVVAVDEPMDEIPNL